MFRRRTERSGPRIKKRITANGATLPSRRREFVDGRWLRRRSRPDLPVAVPDDFAPAILH